jgi:hypothetical protein
MLFLAMSEFPYAAAVSPAQLVVPGFVPRIHPVRAFGFRSAWIAGSSLVKPVHDKTVADHDFTSDADHKASAPEMISISSLVIAAWRVRL